MPKFSYTARDSVGKRVRRVEMGSSKEELLFRLQAKGWVVVSIDLLPEIIKPAAKPVAKRGQHRNVKTADLTLFCRQLATLLGAGVAILEGLTIISKQVASRRLAEVILKLKSDMEAGASLHEAMSKHRTVFSGLWVNLVESGEASGSLAEVLSRMASYLERNSEFRSKIISALIYPAILLFVGIVALLFLTIQIIPTFASLFEGFDLELPLLTALLIAFSNLMRKYFLVMIGGGILAVIIIKKYISIPWGRRNFERAIFKLPLLGEFLNAVTMERFAAGMSTLIESGVPILYALEISEKSVDNLVVSDIIHNVKQEVKEGHSLNAPMEKAAFFEPLIVQMVKIGEEIGDLGGMFKRINNYSKEKVEVFLARFTAMFEPMVLVIMGTLIGLMVIGMFLPIFQISQIR